MKNLKKILFILIGALSTGFIATSCKDSLTEEEILNLSTEADALAAASALEAINAAGEMVSFQVKVVDTDGMGVEGLDVTMIAASEGGVADNQTLNTDASGLVFFDRVAIGGNTISISGETIFDALLSVDFGSIQQGTHYQVIDGQIIPTPVTENAIITVLGSTTAVATVTGVATIETDLTNDTKEVPQDLTILADFDDGLVEMASINVNYFLATNDHALAVGTATVDNATGAYSMEVPAGVDFDLLIPEVQADQRMAINGVDGNDLDQPEYRDILTRYGSNVGANSIPTVPGARIVFDAPDDGGEGFTLALEREGRSLPEFSFSSSVPQDFSDLIIEFTNYGSGYVASPKVTITDPTGTGAYARAELIINSITAATLTAAGTGYNADTPYAFDFEIDHTDIDGNITTESDYNAGNDMIIIPTDENGEFTQAAFDDALVSATGNFFSNSVPISNLDIVEMRIIQNDNANGDAVYTVTAADSEVYQLQMVDGGSDYTEPSFAFSAGGAAVTVHDFGTSWTYDVDNSGVTAPYTLLPSSIMFYYQQVSLGNVSESKVDVMDLHDFAVDVDGNVQFDELGNNIYETAFYSSEMPRVVVVETESIQASGDIDSEEIIDGQIQTDAIQIVNLGAGYRDVFGATIEPGVEGAPGSGATIEVINGQFLSSGEYKWEDENDYVITNQGSGYLQNINVQNSISSYNVSGSTSNVILLEGAKHVVNINYGTGYKSEDVY